MRNTLNTPVVAGSNSSFVHPCSALRHSRGTAPRFLSGVVLCGRVPWFRGFAGLAWRRWESWAGAGRLDRRVTIPMAGGVDSLNVAASSAAAFHATR